MTTSSELKERKLELIQWISLVDDISLLEKIADLKDEESQDWWNAISEDERSSIDRGIEDAEAGKLKPHPEARAIYEKWL